MIKPVSMATFAFALVATLVGCGAVANANEAAAFRLVEAGESAKLVKLGPQKIAQIKTAAGENLLMRAASLEKEDTALALLKTGALDVNAVDTSGNSALLAAVASRLQKLTAALLAAGARTDLKYDENKENVLFEAARGGDEKIVGLLLAKNPGLIAERNRKNESALFAAVKSAHYALAVKMIDQYHDTSGREPALRAQILERLGRSQAPEAQTLRERLR